MNADPKMAIDAKGLYKSFGEPFSFKRILKLPWELVLRLFGNYKKKSVLKDLSFKVERGSVVGFLGPNGAGKSTSLKVMLNLIRKDAGECHILGFNTEYDYDKSLKSTGALVELPVFYEFMTGFDNLLITANIFKNITNEAIDASLRRVGLFEHKDKKVSQYSTGMRQKLYVAKILLMKPKVIILDEPTSGMDPKGQAEMRDIIKSLAGEGDITVLVSSHLLYEIEQVADYVVIIKDGVVVTYGRVADLLETEHELYELEVAPEKISECGDLLGKMDYIVGVESALRANVPYLALKIKKDSAARVPKDLVAANIDIYNFMRQKRSLEEFFLEVTNGTESAPAK